MYIQIWIDRYVYIYTFVYTSLYIYIDISMYYIIYIFYTIWWLPFWGPFTTSGWLASQQRAFSLNGLALEPPSATLRSRHPQALQASAFGERWAGCRSWVRPESLWNVFIDHPMTDALFLVDWCCHKTGLFLLMVNGTPWSWHTYGIRHGNYYYIIIYIYIYNNI